VKLDQSADAAGVQTSDSLTHAVEGDMVTFTCQAIVSTAKIQWLRVPAVLFCTIAPSFSCRISLAIGLTQHPKSHAGTRYTDYACKRRPMTTWAYTLSLSNNVLKRVNAARRAQDVSPQTRVSIEPNVQGTPSVSQIPDIVMIFAPQSCLHQSALGSQHSRRSHSSLSVAQISCRWRRICAM
jgi:hypothetical protein